MDDEFGGLYRGKRVLVTGHTGFKGAWLCEWLLRLGARVSGFAQPAPTQPALFEQLRLDRRVMRHCVGDLRDLGALERAFAETQPDFVFHLAAQPLVRLSYEQPLDTFATNVLGSAHVLECLRRLQHPCVAVMVATDKCYENAEDGQGFCEDDPLGGADPYSASKGAMEIVVHSYRRSFFHGPDSLVRLGSARAGNCIGGGDWARDRIVPDCIRALSAGEAIAVRNPDAVRPWQHVLEPLSGYLRLGAALAAADEVEASELAGAFNFGPGEDANRTVGELVTEILSHWPGGRWQKQHNPNAVHEAHLLALNTAKAQRLLDWAPVWDFRETVSQTVAWYRRADVHADSDAIQRLTASQIDSYVAHAAAAGHSWATTRRLALVAAAA